MALNSGSKLITLTMGATAAVFVVFIILYPDKTFNASLHGLTLWWKIVFPALLPFLVASEIMIAYGFAHFLGVLLEPAMRLLFKLPGIGGWVVAVGLTAGYPAGADATIKLRNQGLISRNEGERLLCISHLSNPVFVMSVVAVGFFHNPALGLIVLSIHYLSALAVGLLTRLYSSDDKSIVISQAPDKTSILSRCFQAMEKARFQDGRTFGKLLGDAVSSSIQTLMVVGGYIIIFSVILQVLTLSVPLESIKPIITGSFEINLGAYAISQSFNQSPIVWQAAVLGSILAWSGLSVHGQVRSLIHATDLRYMPFLISRCIHAVLAFFLTFWLWQPLHLIFSLIKPGYFIVDADAIPNSSPVLSPSWISWPQIQYMIGILFIYLIILMGISVMASLLRKKYT